MHLAHQQNGLPGCPALVDHRHQVERDVRVAAQAQAIRMVSMTGDHLRYQVQAGGIDVPRSVAVVAADVILLGSDAVQQAAGLHEELLDVDVGRQIVLAQARQEIQLRVVTKHALDKGLKEALLQPIAQRWPAQAKGGIDRQPSLGQLRYPLVQRVDEWVGFAQPQRQAHVDMRRQPGQHLINRLLDRTQLHHLILPWRLGLDRD
ncbi:hypothetical protein D3C73_702570 [compost metagenome]